MKNRFLNWIQNSRKSRQIAWLAGYIILGVTIGYILGLLRVHAKITSTFQFSQFREWWNQLLSHAIQSLWEPFLKGFNAFSPSIGFASDVIAYQAAIIAIAIPLSLEIISRISERYQSGVITREFNRQWQFRALLLLTIIDVLSGVTLKFFVDTKIDAGWKVVAWLIFLLFIATNFALFAFFDNLRQYATKTKFLLNRLFDDMTKSLHCVTTKKRVSNKRLKKAQEQFISALEGVGDVLVFETRNRKNNQYITEGLRQIQDKAQEFFTQQKTQPERFKKLLYSHDLLQLIQMDELEASLQLSFSPQDYLIVLMAIVNQFIRVCEVALEVQNLEIAHSATYNLVWLSC